MIAISLLRQLQSEFFECQQPGSVNAAQQGGSLKTSQVGGGTGASVNRAAAAAALGRSEVTKFSCDGSTPTSSRLLPN